MQLTFADLNYAWKQVARKSPSAGIDGITTELFATVKTEQLTILQEQLLQQSYHPDPARGFYIPKTNGGKRLLGIQTVKDRIVQRWLLEEIYLPLENSLTNCSYAYRPNRGIQLAVEDVYFYYHNQPVWVIKADLKNFFDSLCWTLLLVELEKLETDREITELIAQQLKAGIVIRGQHFYPTQGVLQGAILSGALANLYLNSFDQNCLDRGFKLVRFGDDFVIICHSKTEAEKTLDLVNHLLNKIYLQLQPEKTRIFTPQDEFTFLGYQFRDGQIFAPPPITTHQKKCLLPSGQAQAKPIYIHSFLSRPPQICSISKNQNKSTLTVINPQHYFTQTMTTLYITDQGSSLTVKKQQFRVFVKGELLCQIPVNRVSHIVLFGCTHLTHGAIRLALARRIPVLYLSQRGHYFGRLETDGQAKVTYLTQQVLCSQNPQFVRTQGENIVRAKLHNSRILLMRLNRRHKNELVTSAIAQLKELMNCLPLAESMDALRGYEGKGATVYFQALGSLFQGELSFEKRTKRPPKDPINSLLSLGYTFLSQNVHSFVETMGLHTHFGNLHVPRDNHPALVSDLMEEFRSQVVDSLVAYLINKKIFTPEDFTPPDPQDGVYLHPDSLKKFLKHWEDKLNSEITHPTTGYKVSLRRCLELQVREYIACLIGDTDNYQPMIWKS
jgi:CRISP-associated protein Cas1